MEEKSKFKIIYSKDDIKTILQAAGEKAIYFKSKNVEQSKLKF